MKKGGIVIRGVGGDKGEFGYLHSVDGISRDIDLLSIFEDSVNIPAVRAFHRIVYNNNILLVHAQLKDRVILDKVERRANTSSEVISVVVRHDDDDCISQVHFNAGYSANFIYEENWSLVNIDQLGIGKINGPPSIAYSNIDKIKSDSFTDVEVSTGDVLAEEIRLVFSWEPPPFGDVQTYVSIGGEDSAIIIRLNPVQE